MTDLKTTYLGLSLASPLVPSASPMMRHLDAIREMEACGAGAVVLHSLFEEQIENESQSLDYFLDAGAESQSEASRYLPDMTGYNLGPEGYLKHIEKVRKTVSIPVIASLNGYSSGGWIRYARLMQDAGASALELNMYHLAVDPEVDASRVEAMYAELLAAVRETVTIPIAVKLSPEFTALAHFATRLCHLGADGLVLFNRFYQPDFDLETLLVTPQVYLSSPSELLMRLRWVGLLYGRIDCDLAVTGGVHTGGDVLKALMAGAKVVQMTSALLRHGPGHLRTVLQGMEAWMRERGYDSTDQMRGSMSQKAVEEPETFERANYMHVVSAPVRGLRPT